MKQDNIWCKIYTSASELPPEWFDIKSSSSFCQLDFLVNEQSNLPDIRHKYALVFLNNKPIAKAYFQLLFFKKIHLNSSTVKNWQYNMWSTFVSLSRPAFLVAGHLFRHDEQFFFYDSEISTFTAYKCYKAAIDEVSRHSCASGVLIKDMPVELVDHFQNHTPDYILLSNDISMEMSIPEEWHSITDYEKALKHKYAQRFRKIRQNWQNLNIRELSSAEVRACKDQLYHLYQQVLAHQQVRLGILSSDFLVRLKEHYGDKLKIWAVYENDIMVAFFSGWVKDDAFDMFYIGFDYSRNTDLQSYFNILFSSVEQAITLKKQKLILGRTALDAKARIGCEPRYLHTFLYIRNALLRRLVFNKQQKVSVQEGNWEEKHPFKAPKD